MFIDLLQVAFYHVEYFDAVFIDFFGHDGLFVRYVLFQLFDQVCWQTGKVIDVIYGIQDTVYQSLGQLSYGSQLFFPYQFVLRFGKGIQCFRQFFGFFQYLIPLDTQFDGTLFHYLGKIFLLLQFFAQASFQDIKYNLCDDSQAGDCLPIVVEACNNNDPANQRQLFYDAQLSFEGSYFFDIEVGHITEFLWSLLIYSFLRSDRTWHPSSAVLPGRYRVRRPGVHPMKV